MKRLAGWATSAGLVLAAGCANAQMLAPYHDAAGARYQATSDFDAPYGEPPAPPPYAPPPYAAAPPYAPPPYAATPPYASPPYAPAPSYGYGPAVLPPHEVYAVLRENGFLPLGIPHRHGWVYTIPVVRDGEDGRLIIDARTGRIIRFVPAYWRDERFDEELSGSFGAQAAMPAPTAINGVPRPPLPIPHVANRAVATPPPKPAIAGKPRDTAQEPSVVEAKPAAPPAQAATAPSPQAGATVGEAKPAPRILPTQEMPKVQGLE